MRKASFPPICDRETRVLVLGSLPGEQSLAEQRYYANPRNALWRLMETVLDAPLVALAYEDRLGTLRRRGVGLWDCVGSALRQGSLDAAIAEAETNDLAGLAAELPHLSAVGFNGGAAFKLGAPLLAGVDIELIRLPSSSPAHAGRTFAQKAEAWAALRRYVLPA